MQSPYVEQEGIIPPYGPVSGGTDIIIFGGYLGNSSDISVFLGDTDIEFKVFKWVKKALKVLRCWIIHSICKLGWSHYPKVGDGVPYIDMYANCSGPL